MTNDQHTINIIPLASDEEIEVGEGADKITVLLPAADHVAKLLTVFDKQRVPVFFKDNLWGNPVADSLASAPVDLTMFSKVEQGIVFHYLLCQECRILNDSPQAV